LTAESPQPQHLVGSDFQAPGGPADVVSHLPAMAKLPSGQIQHLCLDLRGDVVQAQAGLTDIGSGTQQHEQRRMEHQHALWPAGVESTVDDTCPDQITVGIKDARP